MADDFVVDQTIEKEILDGFLAESLESFEALDALFIQLENNPENIDVIHPIFRAMHSLKGNAPFFGLLKVKMVAHNIESVLVGLREKKFSAHKALINKILEGIDLIRGMLHRVQHGEKEVDSEAVVQVYCDSLNQASTLTPETAPSRSNDPTAIVTKSEAPSSPSTPQADVAKTMRIPEEKVDTFLSFVGELIVVGEMLRHFSTKLYDSNINPSYLRDFGQIINLFGTLSTDLEKAIMSIRKVPVKTLLQRVPRIARDVANTKQKEIKVTTFGESTEIDKSLLELFEAPLMHMVRNAADHGIESPQERKHNGKSSEGAIVVGIVEDKADITLTVEDDGAGLNFEKLRNKAESIGFIKPGQPMGKKEIIELLFLPGVSTAQQVTDISGRGVGMDVVKKSIESAGGKIDIESTPGEGSKFTVTVPKTISTQIIQGYVVSCGYGFFVFPLEAISESWCVAKDEIGHVLDKGGYVSRHDELLPCFSLADILGINAGDSTNTDEVLLVNLNTGFKKIALIVNAVVGVRQLVIKELDDKMLNTTGLFGGAALLGDGSIALVIDPKKISDCLTEDCLRNRETTAAMHLN